MELEQPVGASLVGRLRRTEPGLDELEAGLNRLIEGRAQQADDAQREAESWKVTTAAYNAEEREANRWKWIAHYSRLGRAHMRISERLEAKANSIRGAS